MANASKKLISSNCEILGSFEQHVFEEYKTPKGGYETTLTSKGIEALKYGERREPFHILVPNHGWVKVQPK